MKGSGNSPDPSRQKESNKMQTITKDTIVYSPRTIANGQGRWIGTVEEVFSDHSQPSAGTALGNLETALYEDGRLHDSDLDRGFDIETHAHLLTLDHVRDLLDDPNAEIVDNLPVHSTASEAIEREIVPVLGDHAPEFDIANIADEVIQTIGHQAGQGDTFGFVVFPLDLLPGEDRIEAFWRIVEAYNESAG